MLRRRSVGLTALDSGIAEKGQIDIKCAGGAVCFARDGADWHDAASGAGRVSHHGIGSGRETGVGVTFNEGMINQESRALERIATPRAIAGVKRPAANGTENIARLRISHQRFVDVDGDGSVSVKVTSRVWRAN